MNNPIPNAINPIAHSNDNAPSTWRAMRQLRQIEREQSLEDLRDMLLASAMMGDRP